MKLSIIAVAGVVFLSCQAPRENTDSIRPEEQDDRTYIEVRETVNPRAVALRDEVAKGCDSLAFFERAEPDGWVVRAPSVEHSERIEDVVTDDEMETIQFFLDESSRTKMPIPDYINLGYSGSGSPPPCSSS